MNNCAKQNEGLASKLWNLAIFIRGKVSEAKSQNKLVQTSETHVRPKFEQFEYGDGGIRATRWTTEYFDKTEWHWRHQNEFIQTILKSAPTFQECSEMLKKEFSGKTGRLDCGLYDFARAVAFAAIEELSDAGLAEIVSKFVGDLNNAPTNIRVSAWVDGLWLKDEQILLPDFVLRRPTLEDVQVERPISMAIHSHFGMDAMGFSSPAILDFTIRTATIHDTQEEVLSLMNVFRLFRLGSVQSLKYLVAPDSILRPGFTSGHPANFHAIYKYALATDDQESLNSFLKSVKPLVRVDFKQPDLEKQPADLAFLRYSDAVLTVGSIEARITAAITCLEALYLKGEERSELSHKLSLRAASLLRLLDANPIEIQNQIHRAYEIRSTHIHGGQVAKDRLKDGDDLCRKILECARQSVVVFLQLKGKVEKDEFLNKLDRALLEQKSLERVQKQLEELVIPK